MLRFLASFIVIFLSLAAHAEDRDDASRQLSTTTEQIKAVNARQKKIAQENARLERELKLLQEETVSIAKQENNKEDELADYEDKLAILEDQKTEKSAQFSGRQSELSALISAMIRLKELPPETVIALPGKFGETLAAARYLNIVTHTIEEDAKSLKAQLHELDALEEKIRKNHQAIVTRKTDLEKKRADLAAKVKERSKLQEELGSEEEEDKEKLAKLNEKSNSLQELIDALGKPAAVEKNEGEDIKANSVRKNERRERHPEIRSFADAKGDISMPASGKIVKRYNSSSQDTFSRGITIATHENADIVAPFDGEVVYAGNFRDYGRIVIIRHSDDYHTLLSGMEHLSCKPGQFLMEGEPIGTMGSSKDERRLYIELRRNSKPIDPMPWLKG